MIYFIQVGDDGPIKIGYASRVSTRIGALQVSNPAPLRLLASTRGELDDEARVHRKFAEHRLRGEWFSPVPEILAFCETLERAAPNRAGIAIWLTMADASATPDGS